MNQDRFWHIWCTVVVVRVMLCDRLLAIFAIPFRSSIGQLFTSFMFLHFAPVFLQFPGFCHALRSSILSLCICYLTTNDLMLSYCTYEIWDTIFIQFILIFVLLYFGKFLLCSIKILQANLSSIFANPSEKVLLQ